MKTRDIKHLSSSQYASADKLHARWSLYDFTVPKINMYQMGIDHLRLKGNEDILDVGCGDGAVLMNLRRDGHMGKLIGIEISRGMFQKSLESSAKEKLQPFVEFIVSSADDIPFPDKSFDIILAFFMLYHMSDVEKTLYEWKRVLKDNGKVLIATGSLFNKPKHKKFKKMVENLIGKTTSPQFNSSFNLENAEEQLEGIFKITDKFLYEGKIKLKNSEPYLNAFNSIRDMYEPIPSDDKWRTAESTIKTELEREIARRGFFTDDVKRGFFICEKF